MKKIITSSIFFLAAAVFSQCTLRPFLYQPNNVTEPDSAAEVGVPVPTFTQLEFDFEHKFNDDNSFPFLGAACIDIDNDGSLEVFVGGGAGQADGLFRFKANKFVSINSTAGLGEKKPAATYSALSLDFNKDGFVDLLVSRDDGIYIHWNKKGKFTASRIKLELPPKTLPLHVAVSDINADGYADLYVSTFIAASDFRSATYNDPTHARENVMLLNKGDDTFRDITKASGTSVNQNTFLSAFVDLNGDNKQDLVVAENTGRVRIFKNEGKAKFTEKGPATDYGFWMSLAVDDVDGDGDADLFFSNIGNTIPEWAVEGDLKENQKQDLEWGLLQNDGNFKFTSITKKSGLTGMEFGWGASFGDFNLDGRPDLVVAENYIKFYVHSYSKAPGRFLLQNKKGRFIPTGGLAGVRNEFYGQSPLIADFNKDGYPDLLYINMDGPVRAFLNQGAENKPAHYLKIVLPDSVESLGAKLIITTGKGRVIRREFLVGLGYLTDQSQEIIVGLGQEKSIKSIQITWPSGKTKTITKPKVNSRIVVK